MCNRAQEDIERVKSHWINKNKHKVHTPLCLWMAIYNTENWSSPVRTTWYMESQAQPQVQHRECPKEARWWFLLGYWGRSSVPAYTASSSTASRPLTTPSSEFLLRSTAGCFVSISAYSQNLALNGTEGEMCRRCWFSLTALNPARSLAYLVQHLEENGASMRTYMVKTWSWTATWQQQKTQQK